MKPRCIVLLSGGLDSMLAVRLMQQQDIEVEALNFKTIFTCCQDDAGQAARSLGVRLTVISQDDDYLDVVRRPRFGYGKGANPCIDCRIYMFRRARQFMRHVDARFVVSGEVLGQRPMSQKRRDLDVIAHHSGLEDLLLRPLSAKRLPSIQPEREGLVDRQQLYDFVGRGRKPLIALARRLGLQRIPAPSTGCTLTEPRFANKVRDLIRLDPDNARWDFELLRVGRHFRFDSQTKLVVGRHQADNERLDQLFRLPESARATLLSPRGFTGPSALLVGRATDAGIDFAVGLIVRYSRHGDNNATWVNIQDRDVHRRVRAKKCAHADQAATLSSVSSR